MYFTPVEGLGSNSCMKGYKGMLVGKLCKTSKETKLGVAQLRPPKETTVNNFIDAQLATSQMPGVSF